MLSLGRSAPPTRPSAQRTRRPACGSMSTARRTTSSRSEPESAPLAPCARAWHSTNIIPGDPQVSAVTMGLVKRERSQSVGDTASPGYRSRDSGLAPRLVTGHSGPVTEAKTSLPSPDLHVSRILEGLVTPRSCIFANSQLFGSVQRQAQLCMRC